MKEKQLFYIGFIIIILGFTWLCTISKYAQFSQYINKDYITGIFMIMSILMAIGGFLMIFAHFSD